MKYPHQFIKLLIMVEAYALANCFSRHGWNDNIGSDIANRLYRVYEMNGDLDLGTVLGEPYLIDIVYGDILYLATYCSCKYQECEALPLVKECKYHESKWLDNFYEGI